MYTNWDLIIVLFIDLFIIIVFVLKIAILNVYVVDNGLITK